MSKTIEEIKDQVAKETGFHCWSEHKDTGIYDSDVNLIAERYAQSQTQELIEQNAELVEMLKQTVRSLDGNGFPRLRGQIEEVLTKYQKP